LAHIGDSLAAGAVNVHVFAAACSDSWQEMCVINKIYSAEGVLTSTEHSLAIATSDTIEKKDERIRRDDICNFIIT